ncbi:MAG: helix-turn-helix transcriptional regulator [Firmicutes bacterium]|nr:helix-turn-helix transcriptional regulator [Bacillota bacterium]
MDRVLADRNMALNELADRVQISVVSLSSLNTGKIEAIRLSTLNAICRALNCQPGDLLEYVPDEAGK